MVSGVIFQLRNNVKIVYCVQYSSYNGVFPIESRCVLVRLVMRQKKLVSLFFRFKARRLGSSSLARCDLCARIFSCYSSAFSSSLSSSSSSSFRQFMRAT